MYGEKMHWLVIGARLLDEGDRLGRYLFVGGVGGLGGEGGEVGGGGGWGGGGGGGGGGVLVR